MATIIDPKVNRLVTETQDKTTEAPSYYTDYLSGLSQAGTTELAKTPDQLVAPLTALQQQGYATVPRAATAYQPQLATSQQTAGLASNIGAEDISRFMNPYTQNVVDEMQRLSEQNVRRNVMPSLTAAAVGRGDLGSRRYASATGQSLADIQRSLTGQQYGALSAGYNKAVDAATAEAQLQNQVAQTQARQAQLEQELGLSGAKAMTTAGGEQMAYEQSKLEAPLKAASQVAKLMQGQTVPMFTSQSIVRPGRGEGGSELGTSTIGDIEGLGMYVKNAMSDKPVGAIASFLKYMGVKGTGPGGSYTPAEMRGDFSYQNVPTLAELQRLQGSDITNSFDQEYATYLAQQEAEAAGQDFTDYALRDQNYPNLEGY
jgi:hypothetical protein